MTLHPYAFIRANFLFPNRYDLFETVDAVAGGVEDALVAVAGGAGHKCGGLPHRQPADTLNDGDAFNLMPALPSPSTLRIPDEQFAAACLRAVSGRARSR